MIMKKEIKTSKAPSANNILSQAIEIDGLIFTSGQIHLTPEGKLIQGTIEEKTKQVMSNLQAILAAASAGFSDVLKATVYVTDMAQYADFNKIYVTYFSEPFPAREVICVEELPLGATLEISLIAKK